MIVTIRNKQTNMYITYYCETSNKVLLVDIKEFRLKGKEK